MATDQQLQEFVHRIEEGRWVKWMKWGLLLTIMAAMFGAFVLDPWGFGLYKGLNHPKAMEQAQIARELARGNGFSTKMIRPLAYTQLMLTPRVISAQKFPDTFHAPLWPATVAPFLYTLKIWPIDVRTDTYLGFTFHKPNKDRWEMSTRDYVYAGDRMVSGVAMFFFFFSVFVSYFTARRLFDNIIAVWTVVLMMGCALFWRYSMSGLPQMLMLFLFSVALYALVRAVEVKEQGGWPLGWLAGVALCFGLLALTHGIATWAFVGALLFCFIYFQFFSLLEFVVFSFCMLALALLFYYIAILAGVIGVVVFCIISWALIPCIIYFKPRWGTALLMAAIFVTVYSPWVYRNYKVCHWPFGISAYTNLIQIRGGTENAIMRSQDLDTTGISPTTFRRKIQNQLADQMGSLFSSFGNMMVVPGFFLALLHLFKNPVPRAFRWALFSMWLFSLLGMAILGKDEADTGLSSTDLNVLFIPMFAAFGMAFILVLWSRLEINVALVKYAFFVVIFGVCSLPLLNVFTTGNKSPVQWPPYYPPYIAVLRDWTTPTEVIASDMPWAVAWYADRKSLWLPMTIQNFTELTDYERLGGKIAGIYLTPITGNSALINDVVKGDYKDWAPFILRNVGITQFPLHTATALPVDGQCIFYSDRDRWTDRSD